jgi:uncharacterized protein YkwD
LGFGWFFVVSLPKTAAGTVDQTSVKARTLLTTFSTTLVVTALATVWAVASPMASGCAAATPLNLVVPAPGDTAGFVAQINELRASQGLNALSVDGNLTSVAENWAVNMASQDGIFHRTDLRSGIAVNWKRLGENVGMGPNVKDLMQAFIASPGHYKNLVDPTFTHVGVGTVRTPDGLMYTAHEFAAISGAAAAPPVVVKPAPVVTTPRVTTPRVTTPRVTAPPTTAAPVTTTTTEPPVTVERLVAKQHKLHNGSADDHQQEQNKSQGRCGAHGANKLMAIA